MYTKIENGILTKWSDCCFDGAEFVDMDYKTFDSEKYTIKDGLLTDISETDEYKTLCTQREKEKSTINLKLQIEELDKKRIRAIAEPQLKDTESGQTWLEYYTEQIKGLRQQIMAL